MEGIGEVAPTRSNSTPCSSLPRVQARCSMLVRLRADSWLDSLFALAFFIALFSMPADVGTPELDKSWHRALQECFKSRAQAGRDYVFTYGPLGAFLNPTYAEGMYWHKYVWELVINLAIATIMLLFGRRIAHKGDRFLFYAILLVYITPVYDLRFVVSSLALAILLLTSAPRASALVLAGLYFAVLCLGKFTHTVFIVPAILLATTWKWWETGRRIALALPLAFAIGMIGIWLAMGQNLTNLPTFAAMSLEVARGYVDAMSLAGPRSSLFLALAIFGIDVLMFVVAAFCAQRTAPALLGLALMFAALHLEFRHGLIRHDLHCLMFFGFTMTVPFFTIVIEPIIAARWGARLSFGLTLLLAAQAYQQADGVRAPDLPRRVLAMYHGLRTNVSWMTHPRTHLDELRQLEQLRSETYELPKIKALVGSASIDMVSCLQAMLFLNGLNWTPRPVFQSYSVYTPKLLSVNEEYYKSSAAPRFVLFHLDAIDGHFPATEDSGVLLELLQHYRPVMKERDYVLLERRESVDCINPPAPLGTSEQTIQLGEIVPVSSTTGTYSTVSLRFHPKATGKLLQVLYRNPLLYLSVYLSDGSSKKYRLIPGLAAHEFLLNPLLVDDEDFIGLYCGENTKRIIGLSVTQEDFYGLHAYHPEIQLTLKNYPSTYIPQISSYEGAIVRYSALGAIPLRVEGICQEAVVEGCDCVHVEGTVTYSVHPGQHCLSGRYGIHPGAYGPGKTDGVDFEIDYVSTSGDRKVLYRRRLSPNESSEDRGFQTFSVEIPHDHCGGTLQLLTKDAPPHTTAWDWSYWSQIHLE